jgi:hypothetical protein
MICLDSASLILFSSSAGTSNVKTPPRPPLPASPPGSALPPFPPFPPLPGPWSHPKGLTWDRASALFADAADHAKLTPSLSSVRTSSLFQTQTLEEIFDKQIIA